MYIKTANNFKIERETKAIHYLVKSLALFTASNPDKIIDLLTGYLWTQDEANDIKDANLE